MHIDLDPKRNFSNERRTSIQRSVPVRCVLPRASIKAAAKLIRCTGWFFGITIKAANHSKRIGRHIRGTEAAKTGTSGQELRCGAMLGSRNKRQCAGVTARSAKMLVERNKMDADIDLSKPDAVPEWARREASFAASGGSEAAIPHKCPVCNGTGLVSRPPYVAGDVEQWVSDQANHPCRPCAGSGIIWSKPLNDPSSAT